MINVPNPGTWESQVGQQFIEFRNAWVAIVNQNAFVAAIGGAATLEAAPFSMSSNDAAALIAALGNITNLAGTQAAINGTQPFWSGQ
jgi:hypothetical protein